MRFLVSMCSRFLSFVSLGFCFEGSLHNRSKFRSETSDNMDRWKAQQGESQKREEQTSTTTTTTTTTFQLQLHCAASNRLSVHQWVRSAIHHSQQRTSPIGFLSLKLPPQPCAVLAGIHVTCIYTSIHCYIHVDIRIIACIHPHKTHISFNRSGGLWLFDWVNQIGYRTGSQSVYDMPKTTI